MDAITVLHAGMKRWQQERKGYEQAVVLSGRSDVMREVWVKGTTVDVPLSEARKPWNTEDIQVGAPI